VSGISEVERLRRIVRSTLWMACRYAHGRQSYAVAQYNEAAREAEALGCLPVISGEPHFAIDGSLMREMSGLTPAEFEAAWAGWHKRDAIPNHCREDWPTPPASDETGGAGHG
jgi:hypothetical protein